MMNLIILSFYLYEKSVIEISIHLYITQPIVFHSHFPVTDTYIK